MSTLKRCRSKVLQIEELLSFHASTANEFLLDEAYLELTRICVWIIEGKYTMKSGLKALVDLEKACAQLGEEEDCPFLDYEESAPPDDVDNPDWKPIMPGEEK